MTQEKEKSTRNPLIALLVFVVLFVLPAGALYFLNAGKNFRQEYLEELGDFGKIAQFKLTNQDNLPVGPDVMRGKVSVVQFLPANAEEAKTKAGRIAKLHESFDDTDDVVFLSFLATDSSTSLQNEASRLGIQDHEQWYLIGVERDQWEDLATTNFKITEPNQGIALIDTTLAIRNQYNINDNEDMGKLVVHISMIIPKQKKRTGF